MNIQFGTFAGQSRVIFRDITAPLRSEHTAVKMFPDGQVNTLKHSVISDIEVKFEMSCEEFFTVVEEVFKTLEK